MSRPDHGAARDAERAARLLAMGRVLHDAGTDEAVEDAPPSSGPDGADAALHREVPPHHGS